MGFRKAEESTQNLLEILVLLVHGLGHHRDHEFGRQEPERDNSSIHRWDQWTHRYSKSTSSARRITPEMIIMII